MHLSVQMYHSVAHFLPFYSANTVGRWLCAILLSRIDVTELSEHRNFSAAYMLFSSLPISVFRTSFSSLMTSAATAECRYSSQWELLAEEGRR